MTYLERIVPTLAAALALALLPSLGTLRGAGTSLPAQSAGTPASPITPVPFGPGEEAKYQLKLGAFSVGEGRLAVTGVEAIRGQPSYQLEMDMEGGIAFAKVDDEFRSWMDTRTLASRRFIRNVHEVNYKAYRHFEIHPEEKRWERVGSQETGRTLSSFPLDELAFVYYVRTLPLRVGETYELNRYFKDDGNPVVVKVLRRERKEVPAGTFNTIVVQPLIRTSGLFGEGGNAEIFFSDDEHRNVVYLRSEIPIVGSMTLHLTELRQGTPLSSGATTADGSGR